VLCLLEVNECFCWLPGKQVQSFREKSKGSLVGI
jgi:hypothetical protein